MDVIIKAGGMLTRNMKMTREVRARSQTRNCSSCENKGAETTQIVRFERGEEDKNQVVETRAGKPNQ